MTNAVVERNITEFDRCDVCGASAKVVATLLNGELFFCGHHARKAGTNLVLKAIHVYDPDGEFNLLH